MRRERGEELARPELRPIRGGWMALSAPGSRLRIGVVGATQEEAMGNFEDSLVAWERLARAEQAAHADPPESA